MRVRMGANGKEGGKCRAGQSLPRNLGGTMWSGATRLSSGGPARALRPFKRVSAYDRPLLTSLVRRLRYYRSSLIILQLGLRHNMLSLANLLSDTSAPTKNGALRSGEQRPAEDDQNEAGMTHQDLARITRNKRKDPSARARSKRTSTARPSRSNPDKVLANEKNMPDGQEIKRIEDYRWNEDMLEVKIRTADGETRWMSEPEAHQAASRVLLMHWADNGHPINPVHPDLCFVGPHYVINYFHA